MADVAKRSQNTPCHRAPLGRTMMSPCCNCSIATWIIQLFPEVRIHADPCNPKILLNGGMFEPSIRVCPSPHALWRPPLAQFFNNLRICALNGLADDIHVPPSRRCAVSVKVSMVFNPRLGPACSVSPRQWVPNRAQGSGAHPHLPIPHGCPQVPKHGKRP